MKMYAWVCVVTTVCVVISRVPAGAAGGVEAPGKAARSARTDLPPSTLLPGMGDRWKRFTMMVWPYKTPPPGPEAQRLYESVNLHGVVLDGDFPDEALQFAKDHDYPYYVDHSAGKGDLFLRPDVWKKFEDAYRADRSRPVRPVSLWDPTMIARLKGNLLSRITRAKTGPALGYAFDDEISITSYTSPADVDWSPEGLTRFRDWLKTEYGSLAKLNAEWGSAFTGWDEVMPKGVDDIRSNFDRSMDQWNLAQWSDHRQFMDEEWSDLLGSLTRYANGVDPRTPAGFVGGQAPAAYGGYDYALLTRNVQWMEAYDIGCSNEILRSFFGSQHPHVQTYFLSGDPHLDRWFLWYYLVHGDRGVICWPDTDKGPWFQGGKVNESVKVLADTFREVQGPVSESFPGAHFDQDGIAVYYSQPSIRASWFMDIQPHGRTWVNRGSSMNNENATDILNRVAWTKLLEDNGFQYNFVSYRDVESRGAQALKGYKVLILPRTLALSDAEAAAITEFARSGGTVIADYLPGVFDEHGRARKTGALDALFGVRRDASAGVLNGKTLAEVNAELNGEPLPQRLSYDGALKDAEGFTLYERGLHAVGGTGTVVGGSVEDVRQTAGQGLAYYGNWSPLPYLYERSQPAGARYRARVAAELRAAADGGVEVMAPRVQVLAAGKEIPQAERLFWTKNGRHYLCIVMNLVRAARIDSMGSAGGAALGSTLPITIRFRTPVAGLKNVRTGKDLGNGVQFTDSWATDEANIYSW